MAATDNWHQANRQYIINAVKRVRNILKQRVDAQENTEEMEPCLPDSRLFSAAPALESLCQRFKLSSFERDIIILCAGMELDSSWGSLCAEAQGDAQKPYPTFSLALASLPSPNWQVLLPNHNLRRWRIIELEIEKGITSSRLRIDERILHYILGFSYLDERLITLVEPINIEAYLIDSHQQIVNQLVRVFSQPVQRTIPLVQLSGNDSLTKKAIAYDFCQKFGINLYAISIDLLPDIPSQLSLIRRLCEREWLLNHTSFLLDCDSLEAAEHNKENLIIRFLKKITGLLIITTKSQTTGQHQFLHHLGEENPLLTLDVMEPNPQEQREVWQKLLKDANPNINKQIDYLVNHFNFSAPTIKSICWQSKNLKTSDFEQQLWSLCRVQSRPKMTELAQEIKSYSQWDDLVLPEIEKNILQSIITQVRQRIKVYDQWGFGRKNNRGLGISALFAGASGTGKTLAAEVLGNQLKLDVYRIDLSSIVSKYIGETEKNLRRIFDAAEGSGAILLFDEADALFGKRSEVKDSHDRYANLEVSYLLQRIESYRGLAILTTNLKDAIDQAFLRRIRFIVQFPFPDATQRAAIWRRAFPKETPTKDLDFQKLAQLNVAGGNIANIAMNAAFLAADGDEPVSMRYILQATKSEYMKLERPLTDSEVKGWILDKN